MLVSHFMNSQIKCRIVGAFFGLGLVILATALQVGTMMSAHELYVSCKTKWADKAYLERYATCRGYISDIADTLKHQDTTGKHRACIPSGATKGQVSGAVVGLLRSQHYERLGPNPDENIQGGTAEQCLKGVEDRFRSKNVPALELVMGILAEKYPATDQQLTGVLEDHVAGLFTDHDRWCIRIARNDSRHDGRIGHTKSCHPRTRRRSSTTAFLSLALPILQVLVGW